MAAQAMNILLVSPWLPHPGIRHAAGQHFYHTIRSLVERGYMVHVLCYGRGEPAAQVAALKEWCASLTVISPAYTWQQKLISLRRGGWRHPWRLGRQTHHAMRAQIRALCREQRIDIIHFAWTEMGRFLDAATPGVGTVLGTQDTEYLVRPREVALYPPGLEKGRAWRRAQQLSRGERRYLRQAHVTLATSEADRRHLARLEPAARVHVVTPWIDAESVRHIQPDTVMPGRLTFMGAMDRIANSAAARFLIDDVWPLIRDQRPDATLRIVGATPPDALRRLAESDPRIALTGFVPDLAAEWAATDVALAPSLIGGGLLIKVAQPMAAGRPVITTWLGNEGVAAPAGEAVLVADDAPGLAAAALRLLADREDWARVAEAGRCHVLETLDWQASLDRLESAYQTALRAAKEIV
jgi:glycosyltransferase involved in cell wall biosynthesis